MPGWVAAGRGPWKRVPASGLVTLLSSEHRVRLQAGCGPGPPSSQSPGRDQRWWGGCLEGSWAAVVCGGNLWPDFLGAQPASGFLEWVCPRFRPSGGWRHFGIPPSHPARASWLCGFPPLSGLRGPPWAWCLRSSARLPPDPREAMRVTSRWPPFQVCRGRTGGLSGVETVPSAPAFVLVDTETVSCLMPAPLETLSTWWCHYSSHEDLRPQSWARQLQG